MRLHRSMVPHLLFCSAVAGGARQGRASPACSRTSGAGRVFIVGSSMRACDPSLPTTEILFWNCKHCVSTFASLSLHTYHQSSSCLRTVSTFVGLSLRTCNSSFPVWMSCSQAIDTVRAPSDTEATATSWGVLKTVMWWNELFFCDWTVNLRIEP